MVAITATSFITARDTSDKVATINSDPTHDPTIRHYTVQATNPMHSGTTSGDGSASHGS